MEEVKVESPVEEVVVDSTSISTESPVEVTGEIADAIPTDPQDDVMCESCQ